MTESPQPQRRKVRIVSEGVGNKTKVMLEDGTPIPHVRSVMWHCDVHGAATVTLELVATELDVTGELHAIETTAMGDNARSYVAPHE